MKEHFIFYITWQPQILKVINGEIGAVIYFFKSDVGQTVESLIIWLSVQHQES